MQASSAAESPFILFQVADIVLALPLGAVREILPMVPLSKPPQTPDILAGFLLLDGAAIPVLQLSRLLKIPSKESNPNSHLLALRSSRRPLALLVDKALEVRKFKEGAFMPLGEKYSFNDCVSAEGRERDRALHLLAPDRLLLKEEEERIQQLQAREEERLRDIRG